MNHPNDFIIEEGILVHYNGSGGEVIVPEGVTRLSGRYSGLFQGNDSIERVVLPEGLTRIDCHTFSSCAQLHSVVLPSTLTEIGHSAFRGCTSLREIVLPDGITVLNDNLFEDCVSLERLSLPAGLTRIESYALRGCRALRELSLPETLQYIGRQAFERSGLVHISLPDATNDLGMQAFMNCPDLEEIIFPDGLEQLNYQLVSGCSALRSVRFPSRLQWIGEFCFDGCSKLEAVSLPETLRGISGRAFSLCESLTELHLPEGLESLGARAFALCTALRRVAIPGSLREVAAGPFHNCGAVDFTAPSPEVLRLLHEKDFEIKNGVLENYYGPGGDVVLPEEVTAIGWLAFSGCGGLRSVAFHDGVRSIDVRAFRNCGETELIGLDPALRETLAAGEFDIKKGVLRKYNGTDGDVTVPDGVTVIGKDAFDFCSALRSVRLPEGVTAIEEDAFCFCTGLRSVSLPESLRSIGRLAFRGCSSLREIRLPDGLEQLASNAFHACDALADASGLVILNGILFDAIGDAETVTVPSGVRIIAEKVFHSKDQLREISLPEGLEEIGSAAFYKSGLERVTVPAGVTKIGEAAFAKCSRLREAVILEGVETLSETFAGCGALKRVSLPASLKKITGDSYSGLFRYCSRLCEIDLHDSAAQLINSCFGEVLPSGLIDQFPALAAHMTDGALKQYVLLPEVWNRLDDAARAEIFLARQGKPLQAAYAKCVRSEDLASIADAVLNRMHGAKPTAKDCTAAAAYMTLFHDKASAAVLQTLYARLKETKTGARALKTVEEHVALMDRLGSAVKADDDLPPLERRVTELLIAEKRSAKELEQQFKEFYSLTFKDLPQLKAADGHKAETYVLAWLLTAHETLKKTGWGEPNVTAAYEAPGLRPEAAEVAALADSDSLQKALGQLAKRNLGIIGRSKKMFLAFPICRYADAALMAELTAKAPQWRSSVSGNEAPPLLNFRRACIYSDSRAAMLFAERYQELDQYAAIRGVTADELRDQNLSDVGLDERGGKAYDLGSQTVTARLQRDLTFLFEQPSGKTTKSLPKKGADEAKYAAAKADFDEMRKAVKKILKSRGAVLFLDFLSGRARESAAWQDAYLKNPLLRMAGGQIVWAQGEQTFTLTADGVIDSAGEAYAITEEPIRVAHPMEMRAGEASAWQKYFSARGLKQPFAQVWEPVIDPKTILPDRYSGSVQPMYRFTGKDRHGIHGGNLSAFSEDVGFTLDDCELEYDASTWRINWDASGETYTLGKFTFPVYTRRVNHIVSLLDAWTVEDRIRKDDTSVVNLLDAFTLAQLTEFIQAAQEANAVNVLAALLEYKNNRFGDFDLMEEFTLEW